MSWSGGTYRKGNYGTNGWTGDASLGIGIEAGRHDTQDDDFANGINACLNKDGSNTATGNLNIGANRITNVAAGTARNDAAQVGQVQDSALKWGGTSGGSANAQTLTLSPVITAYAAGQRFSFLAGFTNTGAATLNVNTVGAKNIFNAATGAAIGAGEIVSGRTYEVVYDGTQFQLLNDITPVQNQDYIWLGTSGGAANAQTASATPAITAYKAGQTFRFLAGFTNTGAATLNINGLGAKNIYDAKTNAALKANQITTGYLCIVIYDGTQFLLLNPFNGWISWTPTITQGVAVTKTVNYAKYRIDGTTCNVVVGCTITSAGTGGTGIQFTLPLTAAATSYRAAGAASYYRAGITQYYTLTALFDATSASYVIFANDASTNLYFGQAPNFAMANNDGLILNLTYELA